MARNKRAGVLRYNKILKEFTAINKQLPEDRKLSLSERRRIIRDTLYPQLKGIPPSKIRVKALRKDILAIIDKIPAKVGCDPNLIDPSTFASIGVFEVDDWISNVIPDCIYIKVSAGDFGETRIFNTRDYNYVGSGVREIVEAIRTEMGAGGISSDLVFQGVKKLRPRKVNDGTPENYFIDLVLFIGSAPVTSIEVVQYTPPKNQKTRRAKQKISNIISDRIKALSAKKRKKKRATKSHRKNVTELRKLKKRLKVSKRPATIKKVNNEMLKRFNRFNSALDRDYKNGLMTEEQYKSRKNQLYDNFLKNGGII